MTKEQMEIAKVAGKSPYRVSQGRNVRYTLASSELQCRAKFIGWLIQPVSWAVFEEHYFGLPTHQQPLQRPDHPSLP